MNSIVPVIVATLLLTAQAARGEEHTVGNPGNLLDLTFLLGCERAEDMVLNYNWQDTLVVGTDLDTAAERQRKNKINNFLRDNT